MITSSGPGTVSGARRFRSNVESGHQFLVGQFAVRSNPIVRCTEQAVDERRIGGNEHHDGLMSPTDDQRLMLVGHDPDEFAHVAPRELTHADPFIRACDEPGVSEVDECGLDEGTELCVAGIVWCIADASRVVSEAPVPIEQPVNVIVHPLADDQLPDGCASTDNTITAVAVGGTWQEPDVVGTSPGCRGISFTVTAQLGVVGPAT